MDIRSNGAAHGVLLLNSNAMDVVLSPDQLSYRTIGGVLDFWFFLGPLPELVTQQYHSLIGLPYLIPFWSLGWQQCHWGYLTLNDTKEVVENYALYEIPLDVVWNDIDYM